MGVIRILFRGGGEQKIKVELKDCVCVELKGQVSISVADPVPFFRYGSAGSGFENSDPDPDPTLIFLIYCEQTKFVCYFLHHLNISDIQN